MVPSAPVNQTRLAKSTLTTKRFRLWWTNLWHLDWRTMKPWSSCLCYLRPSQKKNREHSPDIFKLITYRSNAEKWYAKRGLSISQCEMEEWIKLIRYSIVSRSYQKIAYLCIGHTVLNRKTVPRSRKAWTPCCNKGLLSRNKGGEVSCCAGPKTK